MKVERLRDHDASVMSPQEAVVVSESSIAALAEPALFDA
jgi:hypothetical protein